jgi:hypothetical protein
MSSRDDLNWHSHVKMSWDDFPQIDLTSAISGERPPGQSRFLPPQPLTHHSLHKKIFSTGYTENPQGNFEAGTWGMCIVKMYVRTDKRGRNTLYMYLRFEGKDLKYNIVLADDFDTNKLKVSNLTSVSFSFATLKKSKNGDVCPVSFSLRDKEDRILLSAWLPVPGYLKQRKAGKA